MLQLRKLVKAIQTHGSKQAGHWTIAFGVLNAKAGSEFQVLTGTLRTAKKQKVCLPC
jgi:hypothetical protein